eukprot:scaffold56919_cov69-Phaeocystis_antarctica.AAC.1
MRPTTVGQRSFPEPRTFSAVGSEQHWQPLQRASDAQLLNAPTVCDGNISECIGTSELGMKVRIQLCVGAAVAHGLAPAAAAASSDALRPKPLAASPGTASACILKCAMRLGSKGVELKGVGVSR